MTETLSAASTKPRQPYDPRSFSLLNQIDDHHFWFTTRNRLIVNLTKKALGPSDCFRILEIGCGNGNVLRWLHSAFPGSSVVGMELFVEGLQFARCRTAAPLLVADAHQAPFRASFDLLGMFDVLEHLEDDDGMLKSAANLLRPGGTIFLTVPAYKALWSHVDVASHHCRRYEPEALRAQLESAGFAVQFLSPFMATLVPLMYVARALNRRAAIAKKDEIPTDDLRIVPVVNRLLTWIFDLENHFLLQGAKLPLGTSVLALATKR